MSYRLPTSIRREIDSSDASPATKQLAKEEAACYLQAAEEDLSAARIPWLVRDGLTAAIEERLQELERAGVVRRASDGRWEAADGFKDWAAGIENRNR
jgi:hypothetical protein